LNVISSFTVRYLRQLNTIVTYQGGCFVRLFHFTNFHTRTTNFDTGYYEQWKGNSYISPTIKAVL